MVIEWVVLAGLVGYIVVSLYKQKSMRTRVVPVLVLLGLAFLLMQPFLPFTWFTLLGAFLFERLWLVLAGVLIAEIILNRRKNVVLFTLLSGVSIIIYFYFRTII